MPAGNCNRDQGLLVVEALLFMNRDHCCKICAISLGKLPDTLGKCTLLCVTCWVLHKEAFTSLAIWAWLPVALACCATTQSGPKKTTGSLGQRTVMVKALQQAVRTTLLSTRLISCSCVRLPARSTRTNRQLDRPCRRPASVSAWQPAHEYRCLIATVAA